MDHQSTLPDSWPPVATGLNNSWMITKHSELSNFTWDIRRVWARWSPMDAYPASTPDGWLLFLMLYVAAPAKAGTEFWRTPSTLTEGIHCGTHWLSPSTYSR